MWPGIKLYTIVIIIVTGKEKQYGILGKDKDTRNKAGNL